MYNAEVIADSIGPARKRLLTLQVTFPRFILPEMNTHRVFSRNAASSRALPTKKMLEEVRTNPFVPEKFTSAQAGMQGGDNLTKDEQAACRAIWLNARDRAVHATKTLLDIGAAKQHANRLLEPFAWSTVIITSTSWANFFEQRVSPTAQPEMNKIAKLMLEAYANSTPKELNDGQWHLPYIQECDFENHKDLTIEDFVKISAARCGRVSYLTHDGNRDVSKDLEMFNGKLFANGHWCYDDDTEVLTSNGFVRWDNIKAEHLLGAYNVDGTISFEKPVKLVAQAYQGLMYHTQAQGIDHLVTPNHRVYTSSRTREGWQKYKIESAQDAFGNSRKYLTSAQKTMGEKDFDAPCSMKLLGFFIGDGHSPRYQRGRIEFNLRLPRKLSYLEYLGKTDDLNDLELSSWLRSNCYTEDAQKKLPDGFLRMSPRQVMDLFDGLKNSDGSLKRNSWIYSTTSKLLADQIQALAHVNGYHVSITKHALVDAIKHKQCFILNFSNRIAPEVSTNQAGRSNTAKEHAIYYDGKVYCATVSTGLLMIRRNDKVLISGNSPLEHQAYSDCVAGQDKNGNFGYGWVQHRKLYPYEFTQDT